MPTTLERSRPTTIPFPMPSELPEPPEPIGRIRREITLQDGALVEVEVQTWAEDPTGACRECPLGACAVAYADWITEGGAWVCVTLREGSDDDPDGGRRHPSPLRRLA